MSKKSYINIDSGNRQRTPVYHYDKVIVLPENTVSLRGGLSLIHIRLATQGELAVGDGIVLENFSGQSSILNGPFSLKKNSLYLRVHHPQHGQTENRQGKSLVPAPRSAPPPRGYRPEEDIPDDQTHYTLDGRPQLSVQFTLPSDFVLEGIDPRWFRQARSVRLIYLKDRSYVRSRRDLLDRPSVSEAGNVRVDPHNYLVLLDHPASSNYSDTLQGVRIAIRVKFNSFYGLPVDPETNSVGTSLPLTIAEINDDSLLIETHLPSGLPQDRVVRVDGELVMKRVSRIDPGYPEANNWVFTLPKPLTLVEAVRVVHSTFPNSQPVIRETNNQIFWNIAGNSQTLAARVEPGNYPPEDLAQALSRLLSQPPVEFEVEINPVTNLVSFSAYQVSEEIEHLYLPERVETPTLGYLIDSPKESQGLRLYRDRRLELDQGLIINWSGEVMAAANRTAEMKSFRYDYQLMTLQWPGNPLRVGDLIVTDQFYDPLEETQGYIFRVKEVLNGGSLVMEPTIGIRVEYDRMLYQSQQQPKETDRFSIERRPSRYLDVFFSDVPDVTSLELIDASGRSYLGKVVQSGVSHLRLFLSSIPLDRIISAKLPVKIQLLMGDDSILPLLGFASTTDYRHRLTNRRPDGSVPSLRLSGEDSAYLLSKELSIIPNTGQLTEVFQIINWHHPPGTVCYDSHSEMTKVFSSKTTLRTIDLRLVNRDGTPYQLADLDYQLLLEVSHS